jgi:Domain of unknown function (DUF5615)
VHFLADESCDFAVVAALRTAGHDVSAVAEISPRAKDPAVLAFARAEARVLLTEDKDFGLLAYDPSLTLKVRPVEPVNRFDCALEMKTERPDSRLTKTSLSQACRSQSGSCDWPSVG